MNSVDISITRQELQDLKGRAWLLYEVTPENSWRLAYANLISACDHLDAQMARNAAGAGHPDYVSPDAPVAATSGSENTGVGD